MTVQRRAQPLLVEVMPNETDAASENEQAVERTNLDVLVRLFRRERARITQQVNEAHRDTAVDVQDERVLLRCGDLLDSKGVVEQRVRREVPVNVLLHELDTQVRVVRALDLMANTADYSERHLIINNDVNGVYGENTH